MTSDLFLRLRDAEVRYWLAGDLYMQCVDGQWFAWGHGFERQPVPGSEWMNRLPLADKEIA